MNQINPVVTTLDTEITNTLQATHQKLADLSETATRMNTIISEVNPPRVRSQQRLPIMTKWILTGLFAVILGSNIGLAIYVTHLNDNYQQHLESNAAIQAKMLTALECAIAQHNDTFLPKCRIPTETQ